MQRIEKERAETFGSLKSSIESVMVGQQALQKETRTLVNALRRPEVRGQWGELTLRRLAELAGMVEHCDFAEQVHVRTEDGALRPDMVVHMPEGRDLVVDVKTPLDAYLEAVEATSDEARAAALRRHAQAVAERVRQLSAKNYWNQFEKSPDFVILFIPGDQFLSAALAELPSLIEDAIRQNVIITTPSSFVAILKTVAYGWRQTVLAQNAETIRTLAEELYKRLGGLHQPSQQARPQPRAPASRPSTAPSARSNARCCPARASSPSSACGRIARSRRSTRWTSWRASRNGARTTTCSRPCRSRQPASTPTSRRAEAAQRGRARRLAGEPRRAAGLDALLLAAVRTRGQARRSCARCTSSMRRSASPPRAPITTSHIRACSGGAARSIVSSTAARNIRRPAC